MQVQPLGLAILPLPFADEVREVTQDPKVLGDAAPAQRAPPAAVAAAGALVDAMTDPSVTRSTFRNPEAEFAAAVLRTQVTGEDAPAAEAFPDSIQAYVEASRPVPESVLQSFLNDVRPSCLGALPA